MADTLWACLATAPITGSYAAIAGRVKMDLQNAWGMLDRGAQRKVEALAATSAPATDIIRQLMSIDMNLYRAAAAVMGIQAASARVAAPARGRAGKTSAHPQPDYLAFDYSAAFELTLPQ